MFPNVLNINTETNNSILKKGKVFKFDFEKKKHIVVDGNLVECDFIESIKQLVNVVIKTEIDKFKVYTEEESSKFGLSIYKNIGKMVLKDGFVLSELKREIEEQLTFYEEIESLYNFEFNFERKDLKISFDLMLNNGEVLNYETVVIS